MGHFCRICARSRPNEQFSGRGHRINVCKTRQRVAREKPDRLEHFDESVLSMEAELKRQGKGGREKVEIAWRLRQQTTMTLKWIAQRLRMGTWTHVSNCLTQRRNEKEEKEKCQ